MRTKDCRKESGVALLLSILALLLLSAIAVSMMYMSSTEASVNGNFKNEETEYFAARAGIEEIRDRMIPSTAPYSINGLDGINPNAPNPQCPGEANCYLPTQLPNDLNLGSVVYLLQSGMTTSQIFTAAVGAAPNPLFDDELCHDYAGYGQMTNVATNVRCTTLPGSDGQAWYSIPGLGNGAIVSAPGLAANSPGVSFAPNWQNGAASNPLDWKWASITLKANNSTAYCVDGTSNCSLIASSKALVCYNGTSEVPLLPAYNAFPAPIACQKMIPPATPVYLVTALAVSSSGARRLIQSEMAQAPPTNAPGLFATGNGCGGAGNNPPIIPFQIGGGATTYSYDGNTLANPTPTTANTTGGNVGANGAISLQGSSTSVNGTISSTLPAGITGCPTSSTAVSGQPTVLGTPITSLTPQQIATDMPVLPTPYNPPVPPIPSKVPTTLCTAQNGCLSPIQSCTKTCNKVKGKLVCGTTCVSSGYTLAPGSYGDIQLMGGTNLTLTGGTYNINSITVTGNSNVTVAGSTTINLAGQTDTNFNASTSTVADFTGGSLTNSSNDPSNLTINYGGTGAFDSGGNAIPSIILNGGSGVYAIVNAPLANLSFKGGGNFYGQATAETIDDRGGTNFYYDTALNNNVNDSPFVEVTMRELSY